MENVWECKIGGPVGALPPGADSAMRKAATEAYRELTGTDAGFVFSGWGASLTEAERAVVEDREPARQVLYALASGSYSTYRLHCVFIDRADADRAVDAGAGEFVETLPVYESGQQPVRMTVWEGYAAVGRSAHFKNCPPNFRSEEEWIYGDCGPGKYHVRDAPGAGHWEIRARGIDRAEVEKIVTEQYAAACVRYERPAP